MLRALQATAGRSFGASSGGTGQRLLRGRGQYQRVRPKPGVAPPGGPRGTQGGGDSVPSAAAAAATARPASSQTLPPLCAPAAMAGSGEQQQEHKHSNALVHEQSPCELRGASAAATNCACLPACPCMPLHCVRLFPALWHAPSELSVLSRCILQCRPAAARAQPGGLAAMCASACLHLRARPARAHPPACLQRQASSPASIPGRLCGLDRWVHLPSPLHMQPLAGGEEAFERARRQDKPIFLSVGDDDG